MSPLSLGGLRKVHLLILWPEECPSSTFPRCQPQPLSPAAAPEATIGLVVISIEIRHCCRSCRLSLHRARASTAGPRAAYIAGQTEGLPVVQPEVEGLPAPACCGWR